MQGMNRNNGQYMSDFDHLRQSIADILTTPIGGRVMRRDYGSRLFELIDLPINKDLFPKIYAAIAEALEKWESRIRVNAIKIVSIGVGEIVFDLDMIYLLTQEQVILKDIKI